MGREQRRKQQIREATLQITREALDKGRIVGAGWAAYAATVYPQGMTDSQREQVYAAFFAGAQHLFASMASGLDADAEPTEADMRRMELIHSELQEWMREHARKHGIPETVQAAAGLGERGPTQ